MASAATLCFCSDDDGDLLKEVEERSGKGGVFHDKRWFEEVIEVSDPFYRMLAHATGPDEVY